MPTPSRINHSVCHNNRLHLETPGPSASTSALELAALALDVGLLVLVGTETEMLDGLAGVLGAAEEEGVGAGGRPEGKLIDGEGLAAGGQNAGTGRGGEAEGRDGELGDLEETDVVSDGADLFASAEIACYGSRRAYNDDGLVLVSILGLLAGGSRNDLGDADRYSFISSFLRSLGRAVLRGRLTLDIMSLRRMTLLKGASVRPRIIAVS